MDDRAWQDWLAALGDPRCELTVVICGHYRQRAWNMGRRRLNDHMLHLVIAGGQQGQVGGMQVQTGPGDLLWVPTGCEQVLRQRSGGWFEMHNLRFTLAGAVPPPIPTVLPSMAALREPLQMLRSEWLTRLPGREARLRAGLLLIFSAIWRAGTERRLGLDAGQQEQLLVIIDREPAARPSPADLARALGLTPTWFARLFRRSFGRAPRGWLVRHRIRRAAERLESAASVGEVAEEFGYADLFLFSRQFRAVMGCSPRDWRAGQRSWPVAP